MKGNFNPNHNAQLEAAKIKMVKDGNNPDKEYLLNLRFELTSTINPLEAPNSILNTYMLENIENWVALGKEKKVLGGNDNNVAHGIEFLTKKCGNCLLMTRIGENARAKHINKPECLPMYFTGKPRN